MYLKIKYSLNLNFLKKMNCVTLQSSQSLWHRLSVLLNILPKESVIAGHGKTSVKL